MSFLKKRVLLSCLLSLGTMLFASAVPIVAQPYVPPTEAEPTERALVQHSFLVSPNGQFVAAIVNKLGRQQTGSLINLWEVASGRLLWQKSSPANFGVQGFYSPDGKRLVFHGIIPGPQDGGLAKSSSVINIWSVPSGEELLALKLPEGDDLLNLALAPDDQRMIGVILRHQTAARPRFVLQEWDAATGKHSNTIEDKPQLAALGSWLSVGGHMLSNRLIKRDNGGVQGQFHIWSLPELQLLHSLNVGEDIAHSRALSPDGKRVAFSLMRRKGDFGQTYLWNTEEEKPHALTFAEGFETSIFDFLFTSDSQTLIGAVNYMRGDEILAEIRFWDAQTAKTKRTFRIPLMLVREGYTLHSVRIFPDGKQFVLIGAGGIIELRSLEDGELIRTFEQRNNS